ncbi:bifunctional fucokinase/fucose-1-phosphate guanylyltransferase [uncultured Draconibacterium sp.]|uniref:bifunctional fucokinase/fucose-1-phosphate guanylyltransferase n=1 Tax=uncultured Draconibacterium sp. TaxID=1573823 RepID=UPI0025F08976|nr:bifunctional fucokinase/fucose-1-phosphate guanylyltransferase [uncultured Draconibacterium sp.]
MKLNTTTNMKHLISVPPRVVPHFHSIAELSKEEWFVSADPENKKVGSGGGTAHLLAESYKQSGEETAFNDWLEQDKKVIIHAGGQSRRLPAYAPLGKSLIPMPVFRWSRGQVLNQRLVHLQTPLFDRLMEQAPASANTLVASGDTLIFGGKNLPEIPDADVVCFGLWLEPEKATNHGVFFARHETPGELAFMLQKPPISKISELIHDYYFLMDIGIWMLSARAVKLLMKNCGWTGTGFKQQTPSFYDMYSQFGTALGKMPSEDNEEISALSVALVNLEEGEFHHLGNTSELVSSNLAIQNRINNQREIWHKNIKPHQSIFVLNSKITNNFTPANKNIWVENSSIPDTWQFGQNHAFTGIPDNNWHLQPEPGNCLDIIPLETGKKVIRPYGFYDAFRGTRNDNDTLFMGVPLSDWLKKRKLENVFDELPESTDIFNLPLFPVLREEALSKAFLEWLWFKSPEENPEFTKRWKETERMSCEAISNQCSINSAEEERYARQLTNYPGLAANYKSSVFYQLDLKKTADEFVKNKLALPGELQQETNDWIPLHDLMFRSQYRRLTNNDWQRDEKAAFAYLQQKIISGYHEKTVEPKIKLLPDQIAWGRSPVRLDLAGGWTDTPPYCFFYGGKVVNIAVELNGQPPLHCYIKGSESKTIVLRSIDLGAREELTSFDEIRSFENIRSPFSIPKAALALCGFLPEFATKKYASLEEQLSAIGGGLELTILSAVPKGSGLGTSSILAATVLGTLAEVCCLNWDKQEIGQRALALEQLLTTGGGWQDQFGGLFEGLKLLETKAGKLQEPRLKWLPESLFTDPVYKNRILLYYTGITRVAKNILGEIVRGMFLNSRAHLALLEELKQHAENTYSTLLQKDFNRFSQMIERSWQLNQQLDSGTNPAEIQELVKRISPYIQSQKLLGAGGGGFMLILARDEEAAIKLKQELNENPVNPRGRFVDYEVSQQGFKVTKS